MLLRQLKEWDPIDPILSADAMYTEIICFYLFDPPSTDTRPAGGVGRRLAECSPLPDERTHRVFLQERFFFNFLFDFQILYFLPFFSSSGSRAMTREAAEERAEGFPRFSHFSHVENSQNNFSENLLFGSGLFLTPIKMFMRYFCS